MKTNQLKWEEVPGNDLSIRGFLEERPQTSVAVITLGDDGITRLKAAFQSDAEDRCTDGTVDDLKHLAEVRFNEFVEFLKSRPVANPRSDNPERCKCISDNDARMREFGVTIASSAMMLDVMAMKTVYGFPLQKIGGGKPPRGCPGLVRFSHCPFCGTRLEPED